MDFNKVMLIGRLAKDIELQSTDSGKQYAQFEIAVGNGKDSEGNERPADFITCVIWDKGAETLSVYLHKGDRVAIEGRYKIDKYQNDKGENRYKHYVRVQNFEFLNSKPKDSFVPSEPDGQQSGQQTATQTTTEAATQDPYAEFGNQITVEDLDRHTVITDDDLPF